MTKKIMRRCVFKSILKKMIIVIGFLTIMFFFLDFLSLSVIFSGVSKMRGSGFAIFPKK